MSKAEISMCWKLLQTGIKKPAIICILTCEETKPKMSSQLVIGNISQRDLRTSSLLSLAFSMHGRVDESAQTRGVAWSSVAFGKSEITSLIDFKEIGL